MPDPSRTHQVALLVALAAAGAAHALGSPLPSMARPALRGGGGEIEGTSAMQRSVDGVITADEAVTLRGMGLLNGPFQADSEMEPASDVQDAHEAQWRAGVNRQARPDTLRKDGRRHWLLQPSGGG